MRSIRLSLTVYFLALLAVALGAASWSGLRHIATRRCRKRKWPRRKLIEAQYDENCRQERAKLDDQLLTQAQTLARQTADDARLAPVARTGARPGAAGAGRRAAAPQHAPDRRGLGRRGGAQPRPDARSRGGPRASPFMRNCSALPSPRSTSIRLRRTSWPCWNRPRSSSRSTARSGASYRSKSMGERFFPIDPQAFAPDQELSWTWADDSVRA